MRRFDKVAYQREYMRKRRAKDMATIQQQIDKLEIEIETRKLAIKELKKLAAANSSKKSLREADA
jgi:hypothetical protein